ncbi:MAG: hypothetical protein AAB519_00310 [Patescibacteria group bacterium]
MIRRYLLLIGLVTFFTAFCVLFFFVFVKTPGSFHGVWSALTLPQELKQVKILSESEAGSTIYLPESFSYKKYPYTEEGSILLRQKGEKYLGSSSVAPNEELVVFSQEIEADEKGSVPEIKIPAHISGVNPAHSEIMLFFPRESKTERIVSGSTPLFLDDTHFLFFATSGLYRYDLQSGNATKLLDHTFPIVLDPVLQSPDRKAIAFYDPSVEATVIYRVDGDKLSFIREIPQILVSPSFSNTALYDLRGADAGTEVWKYDFEGTEARKIHIFPRALSISRIAF